ncbi:MAG TPA: hypothetical protein PKA64_15600, partial [Myxococcota bacterium]|nr:hypothetical protein [Myxococcota bacterium]
MDPTDTLQIPASTLTASELLTWIQRAGLHGSEPRLTDHHDILTRADPVFRYSLQQVVYQLGDVPLTQLLQELPAIAAKRSLPPQAVGLVVGAVQHVFRVLEAQRHIEARNPLPKLPMTAAALRQWCQSVGLQQLGAAPAWLVVDRYDPRFHDTATVEDMLTSSRSQARSAALAVARAVPQIAAEARIDATPPPPVRGAGCAALQAALLKACQGVRAKGTPGAASFVLEAWVDINEDTMSLGVQRWVMSVLGASFRISDVEIALRWDSGELLVVERPSPSPIYDIGFVSLYSWLARVWLPTMEPADVAAIERVFHPEPWRAVLGALSALESTDRQPPNHPLLGWRVRLHGGQPSFVEAVRVTPLKRGNVRLAAVGDEEALELTGGDPDERRRVNRWRAARRDQGPTPEQLVYDLEGHPRVFLVPEGATATSWVGPVPVRSKDIGLEVTREGETARVNLTTPGFSWSALRRMPTTSIDDVRMVTYPPEHDAIECLTVPASLFGVLRALARVEGMMPAEALPTLLASVPALARRAAVHVRDTVARTQIAPDPRLHLELSRQGVGLRVMARSIPIPGGPTWPPGGGPETAYVSIDGELLSSERDLASERARWEAIAAAIAPGAANDDGVVTLETADAALLATARQRAPHRDEH